MKLIAPFSLLMAVGLILAAGCVAVTNKKTVNATTVANFAPFSNISDPGLNKTINATANYTANYTTKQKGPLRVSISGYPADLPVTIDNKTVGVVSKDTCMDLMLDEGFHTVMVCAGVTCEQDNVTISFAKRSYLDFGERLRKDVEFLFPTARIVESFKNGHGVSVNVEFINPTTKPVTISAEVSCGYSYIDSRSQTKLGDSAKGKLVQFVEAGQHLTQRMDLSFVSSSSYSYDDPNITDITIK